MSAPTTFRLGIAAVLITAVLAPCGRAAAPASPGLRVGVVQMAQTPTLAGNRERIVAGVTDAARRGARVVVLPEAALMGTGSEHLAAVDEAVAAIRQAAVEHQVYVMFGATTSTPEEKRVHNWMLVLGPDGRELLRYGKLYDRPKAPMPGVFDLDGILCGAIICADRWLRGVEEIPIQQGAKISFELSCNSAVEWVEPFGWYWYVPRAVRNSVWVVFANTGNTATGVAPYPGAELRHGHSAIIAPDGRIVARSRDDVATVVMADLDVREATRTAALARSAHPALRAFWQAGVTLQTGQPVAVPPFTPLKSPAVDITIAAALATGNLDAMEAQIREARRRQADLIVFPARATAETALPRLQAAALASTITVVLGAEHRAGGRTWNSAFVIDPDGRLQTRYDQLSAMPPYKPGNEAAAMWFRVKGVPAVVTIGGDGLWSELAELAALAGAQVHVHLEHEPASGPAAMLRRQVWANLASYQTFTATVSVDESMIWDDLRSSEERRAPIGHRLPESGEVEVYSQYSANLVARATAADPLLVVTRHVNPANLHHTRTVARKNPQMEAWYRLGAASLQPR